MKVKILAKPDATELKTILKENGIEISDTDPDIIIAYGGDGTTLHVVPEGKPVLPVKSKGSFGFVADFTIDGFREAVKNLNEYKVEEYPMIDLYVNGELKDSAANDVLFAAHIPRAVTFNVDVNGKSLLTRVIGDGVIIATKLGSSAYNFSVDGPVLMTNAVVLSVNNSHSHRNIRYVFSQKDVIEVEAATDAVVICDGRAQNEIRLKKGDRITVKKSENTFKLVRIPGFEEDMFSKNNRLVGRICE